MTTEAIRAAEARIYEMDRDLAPGSETALLGPALESLRSDPSPATIAWWAGAYRMLAWARDYPDAWDQQIGRGVWDGPDEQILVSGEDWTGWTPPAASPHRLRSWRDREGLTQAAAASLAGVERLAWQRWESGARSVPQWLPDVLVQRWGTAP